MPFESEQDERKVAAYVGLPAGLTLTPIVVPDWLPLPPEWGGYRIIQWGARADWDIDLDGEPPWPRAILGVIARLNVAGQPVRESHVYQLWLIQVYRPGYPLAAERRWHPELDIRDAIVGLHEPHKWPDVLAAHRGQQLIMAQPRYAGGRRRLEESPSSPWRVHAESARELLTTGEVETIRDAAVRLALPKYDDRHPELDGKAEETAERRLSRWLQRLNESDGQAE